MPPLRTNSIGFKVCDEEYALLETAAQASGPDARRMVPRGDLRGGSASDDPALAEIVGVRLLLENVLRVAHPLRLSKGGNSSYILVLTTWR